MQFQKQELLKALPDNGWKIVEIDEQPGGPPFYADGSDEIITIESVWSPSGFRVYVIFEIAVLCDYRKRRKGENVWLISVSAVADNNDDSNNRLPVSYEFPIAQGHWPESLKGLLAALNKLRQTALAETNFFENA